MRRYLLLTTAAILWGSILSALAQGHTEEFTVATLNIDGLPTHVIGIPVNIDGPGEKYTPEIADYLLLKDYDLVGLQENFNYYDLLFTKLETSYHHDQCLGKISLESFAFPFPYDGISLIWHHGIQGEHTQSVCWDESYGIFSHAADALTDKGFRRYDLTLKGGSEIVVYNGHWDASYDKDEESGRDGPDREARIAQWRQIRDSIMARLDKRPVIVLGDMNSYYPRDDIKSQFVDYIESTGKARVFDAWVELERNGEYPAKVDGPVTHDENGWGHRGEVYDKILFINPTDGGQLTALSYSLDKTGYMRSDDPDKPFGDHFPVAVKFRIVPTGDSGSGIESITVSPYQNREGWYDLQGRRFAKKPTTPGIYLHHGQKILIR